MYQTFLRCTTVVLVVICVVLVTGCSLFGQNSSSPRLQGHSVSTLTQVTNPDVHNVEVDLLNSIKTYGFNADPRINNGMGGLLINWRYGTNPLDKNVNGTGDTDDVSGQPLRHDELTDLRYLHNLWSYAVQNPHDTTFKSELARFTAIVKREFVGSRNVRGWLYDDFVSLYKFSHNEFYKDTALSLIKAYSKQFDAKVGSLYQVSSSHPQGSYRVDLTLEAGCALIQAGTQFSDQPSAQQWLQQGQSIVDFVYTHAYIPQYHAFPDEMDRVLHSDGSVNNDELFYRGRLRNYTVYGNHMQMGGTSQIIISLLDTYQVTQSQVYLAKATDLLDQLSKNANPLGLWDNKYGGYYFALDFNGKSPAQPGTTKVEMSSKEAGRQVIMLQAFHLADKFTNNRYIDMENSMLDVALHHAYNPAVHGVLYLVKDDWTPQNFRNGKPNNMVTTEAMGAELESLFSLNS